MLQNKPTAEEARVKPDIFKATYTQDKGPGI